MDRKKQAFEIFDQAYDLPSDDVGKFLDAACGDDQRLRRHVQRLLDGCEEDSADTEDAGDSTRRPAGTKTLKSNAVADSVRFLPGSRLSQRYRIVSLVGQGTMGEVYRADDLKLGHPVAIKLLPPKFAGDPKRLEFFHNEVRLSRQISHPNVCRVYDIGEFEDLHFLTMEYVDGEDLKSLLRRIGKVPGDKGVEIAQQICAGLASAHDLNVIHRDLKPANIMIDGQGRARITDFGLARTLTDSVATEVAGTPIYMAPEQLSQGTTNIQTDVFALGLVLQELFTGKAVFPAKSLAELRRMHDEAATLSCSSLTRDIDPLVATAIQSCLEIRPENRAQSCRAVGAALPGGEPLAAALAAGHTPTPDQVAASGGSGAMSLRAVVVLMVAIVLGIVAVLGSSGSSVINQSGLNKHPQILLDDAKALVSACGYVEPPIDYEWGLDFDRVTSVNGGHESDPTTSHDQQRRINFWYRHSPRVLTPSSFRDHIHRNIGRVTYGDPPLAPGMARLILDASGRLLRFEGMPSAENADVAAADFPWSEFLDQTLAGALDLPSSEFVATKPTFAPAFAFDQRRSWTVNAGNDRPTHIEAASRGRRVVYLQVDRAGIKAESIQTVPARRAVLYLLILAGSAVFSLYNFTIGLGDRTGARRLAIFVLVGHLVMFALVGSHTMAPSAEGPLVQQGVALSIFAAVELWMGYMAVEPLVRRVWPRNLISWYRVLAGRFRDPLVGQQILLGVLVAIGLRLMKPLGVFVADSLGEVFPIPLQMTLWPLRGTSFSLARIIASLIFSIQLGLTYLFSFVVLRMAFRRSALALVVFSAIWTAAFSQYAAITTVGIVFMFAAMFAKGAMLVRCGLLSVIVILFVERLLHWPVSMDASVWYFPIGLCGLVPVAAIALYGGYTAAGGRQVFLSRSGMAPW